MVLPHEVVPWLQRRGAWPTISQSELDEYWANLAGKDWADRLGGGDVHPLFLWGDDCQFNESREKLIMVSLGHALDKRTFSLECGWPVIALREEPWTKMFYFQTLWGLCWL